MSNELLWDDSICINITKCMDQDVLVVFDRRNGDHSFVFPASINFDQLHILINMLNKRYKIKNEGVSK